MPESFPTQIQSTQMFKTQRTSWIGEFFLRATCREPFPPTTMSQSLCEMRIGEGFECWVYARDMTFHFEGSIHAPLHICMRGTVACWKLGQKCGLTNMWSTTTGVALDHVFDMLFSSAVPSSMFPDLWCRSPKGCMAYLGDPG